MRTERAESSGAEIKERGAGNHLTDSLLEVEPPAGAKINRIKAPKWEMTAHHFVGVSGATRELVQRVAHRLYYSGRGKAA